MNNKFCHLHTHSTFSFQDGLGLPSQYIDRCQEIEQPAIAITDHGNTSGHFKWYKECKDKGIKPILGCEMYVTSRIPGVKRGHMTLLTKDNEGYRNLLSLVTESWTEENFNRKPLTTIEDIVSKQKGLVILSGCGGSEVSNLLIRGKDKEAEELLMFFKENIDDFYIEIMPVHFGEFKKLIPLLYNLSKKLDIPMVATMDCHYPLKEQADCQEILLAIQTGSQMSDPKRWKFDQTDFYLKTREEMEQSFKAICPELDFTEAFDNTIRIADLIDFTFPSASPIYFPLPQEEKRNKLHQMCMDGLKEKGLLGNKVYEERMEYEFGLIEKKNFIDYFLIFTDLVNWSKRTGILIGPARGSSAGSLVCYLLKITEVDPIIHGLIFERFIDINREDLPDIDVDFEDRRRPDVKRYLEEKYGADKVGQLATFSKFKGKSIITDFGRVYDLPYEAVTKLKSIIIERSGGDSRASFTIEDTFRQFELAKKYLKEYPFLSKMKEFEGQLRNMSSHASGIIISEDPMTNFCAIYNQKGEPVISLDYEDTNELGFTKFDILGLNTLTSISKALDLIEERAGKRIDIYNLPLDDPKVYDGFNNPKKLFGIFQFDGQSVNQVCRQVKPRNFEELSAISALSRPGPMHGLDLELNEPITSVYIARKLGKIPWKTAHKLLEDITKDTQGVVIYQEQVMRTMREIGNMSWKDTAQIRKLISRSVGVERFNDFQEKFTEGAKENGLTKAESDNIWSAICSFGSWAYNKCISGDTVLINASSNKFAKGTITVKELFENNGHASSRWSEQPKCYRKLNTLSVDCDGRIRPASIKNVFYKGKQDLFEITTQNKKVIKATHNHRFLGKNGFKTVSSFSIGDLIAVDGGCEPKTYEKTKEGKGWTKYHKGHLTEDTKKPYKDFRNREIKEFRSAHLQDPCQHCGKFDKRMELHHVTYDPPKSVMEWLCNRCHKIAELKKGKFTGWQRGHCVKYEIIKSIKYIGAEDTYDIEMEDSSKPTFVANGFISHNSHCVSYSIISYWTMWLKIYYPIEYYSAMTSTMLSDDKIRKVIKEYLREGFELLPVDVNRSQKSFSIDDNNLRVGFTQIKSIGDRVSENIIANQPYKDISDFEKRAKAGNRATNLLSKLGAFDSIGGTKKTVRTLFGDETTSKYEESITFEEQLKICPLAVDFNIFENWKDFIEKNIKTEISKIEYLDPEKKSEVIMGIAYDRNLKDKIEEALTRGKTPPKIVNGESKYCNFVIEDDSDFVTVRVSPRNFNRFKRIVFEETENDSILIVKGRMGSGIRMFFANEISCLNIMKDKIDGKNANPFSQSDLVFQGKIKENYYKNKY